MTLTVDSDLNGASPQFTLTCISTGGPATIVTWTRDSGSVMGDEMSVLNDATTAQYTHTLTVTGLPIGLYQCNVSNDKPSMVSAQLEFQGTGINNFSPLHDLCSVAGTYTCTAVFIHYCWQCRIIIAYYHIDY